MAFAPIECNSERYVEIIFSDEIVQMTTFYSPPESLFQYRMIAPKAGMVDSPKSLVSGKEYYTVIWGIR